MQIPRTDATGGQRGVGTTSGSGKGKENVVTTGPALKVSSRSLSRDIGASTGPSTSQEKKRRLIHGDRSSITEPAS
jgi:hypothetical protein